VNGTTARRGAREGSKGGWERELYASAFVQTKGRPKAAVEVLAPQKQSPSELSPALSN